MNFERLFKLTYLQKEWLKLLARHKGERFDIQKNRWIKIHAPESPQ